MQQLRKCWHNVVSCYGGETKANTTVKVHVYGSSTRAKPDFADKDTACVSWLCTQLHICMQSSSKF